MYIQNSTPYATMLLKRTIPFMLKEAVICKAAQSGELSFFFQWSSCDVILRLIFVEWSNAQAIMVTGPETLDLRLLQAQLRTPDLMEHIREHILYILKFQGQSQAGIR